MSNLKNIGEVETITDMFLIMEPEAIGTTISYALEYLIYKHNYSFDKMVETIKRSHYKYTDKFKEMFEAE